jgi:DNA-binding MarR family transcriptional regulator
MDDQRRPVSRQTLDIATSNAPGDEHQYRIDEQIGFLLRVVNQGHTAVFTRLIGDDLSSMQFSLLARLAEIGPLSQNELGRRISTDGSTVLGIVSRLRKRGLVETVKSNTDNRRLLVKLTDSGHAVYERNVPPAKEISTVTLAMLSRVEAETLVTLLKKMAAGD